MKTYNYEILSERELKKISGGSAKTVGKFILAFGEEAWDFGRGFVKGFYDTAKKI